MSHDGRIVSAYGDSLRIWDMNSGELLYTLQGHLSFLNSVKLTQDDRFVLAGSHANQMLEIWDMNSGELLHILQGHSSFLDAVKLTQDSHSVFALNNAVVTQDKRAVSGWDNTLKVWDSNSCELLHTLQGHSACVDEVKLMKDGLFAVSSSTDHTLKIWDLATGECTATFSGEGFLTSFSVAADNRTIIAIENTGRMHFLRLME